MREFAATIGILSLALVLGAAGTVGAAVCGDGTRDNPEQCDDGTSRRDGCSSDCLDECPSLDGVWIARSSWPGSIDQLWVIDEGPTGDLTSSFDLRVRKSTIASPVVGPLRLAVALGTTAEDLAAARCGDPQPALACVPSPNGKILRCR